MANGGKSYYIKDAALESLAIELFNQEALYGCAWQQLAEKTREHYREMAAGKKPFAVGVSRSKKEQDES